MIKKRVSFFDKPTKEELAELIGQVDTILTQRRLKYRRYSRKDASYNIMASDNGQVMIPVERYIVLMLVGCFAGVSPSYKIVGDMPEEEKTKFQAFVDSVNKTNAHGSKFATGMHNFATTGFNANMLTENDDNEIIYTPLDPTTTVVVYDYSIPPRPIAAIIRQEDGFDLITANSRRSFNGKFEPIMFEDYVDGVLSETYEKELYWNGLSIIPFEERDGIAVYEPVLELIDMLQTNMYNLKNTTEYNDAPKLMVIGYGTPPDEFVEEQYDITEEVEVDVLDEFGDPTGDTTLETQTRTEYRKTRNREYDEYMNKVLSAEAYHIQKDGDIKWLSKPTSYDGIREVLNNIRDLILMMALTPNLSDKSFGASQSGVAHGYKLFAPEQLGATVYSVWKDGYYNMWKLICARENQRNGTNYNYRDIDITFTQNIPTDARERMDIITMFRRAGVLSLETSVTLASDLLGVDKTAEVKRVFAEIGEELTEEDIKKIIEDGNATDINSLINSNAESR